MPGVETKRARNLLTKNDHFYNSDKPQKVRKVSGENFIWRAARKNPGGMCQRCDKI